MPNAEFRFYADLNDFLPVEKRFTSFAREFELSASIKDMIEALGVPHTEVELILCNGSAIDFSHAVRDGNYFSVYPDFRTFALPDAMRLRPPIANMRFVADVHLGRLAGYLRMLGFDTVYNNNRADAELARISSSESRVLLTRDRGLLKRSEVVYGYFVRQTEPRLQLVEVIRRYDLLPQVAPLRRCIRCNTPLESVSKESVQARLEPRTAQHFHDFARCPSCDRIYWAGSHYQHMRTFVERVISSLKL